MKKADLIFLLAAVGVINTWDLLRRFGDSLKDVAISYHPGGGRSVVPSRSQVWSPTFKTDPLGHWADYGCKAFSGRRAVSMPVARSWATEQYGIKEWVAWKDGDLVPAEVMVRARAAVGVRR